MSMPSPSARPYVSENEKILVKGLFCKIEFEKVIDFIREVNERKVRYFKYILCLSVNVDLHSPRIHSFETD